MTDLRQIEREEVVDGYVAELRAEIRALADDRGRLITTCMELRADNERLREQLRLCQVDNNVNEADNERLNYAVAIAGEEIDAHIVEIKRIEADNAELRALLKEIREYVLQGQDSAVDALFQIVTMTGRARPRPGAEAMCDIPTQGQLNTGRRYDELLADNERLRELLESARIGEHNARSENARLRADNERLSEKGMEVDAWCNQLQVEIERLEAYANHERSLGAEGPMIELTDERQEIARLRAALEEIAAHALNLERKKCLAIARRALDHGLPTADDVRGILKEQK